MVFDPPLRNPSVLKDKDGNEVDIRRLRAEAAARRAEAASKVQPASLTGAGKTLNGDAISEEAQKPVASVPVSKRKTRVGSKYSRLKQSGVAFKGSANTMK